MRFKENILFLSLAIAFVQTQSLAQSIPLGKVIITCNSGMKKDASPETFSKFILQEVVPGFNSQTLTIHLFKADRGEKNGEYLLIGSSARDKSLPTGSPFSDKAFSAIQGLTSKPSVFLEHPEAYTKYVLLGSAKAGTTPKVGLLGFHYIKIIKEKSAAFESFIINKLQPAVAEILPGMGLFYYKAVEGDNTGSYILIFVFDSTGSREKCWPSGGAPETELLKNGFLPLKELARELGTYQEEGSYLLPGGNGDNAAAYFESHVWTDYVLVK